MVFLNVSHWLIKCVIIGVTCTLRLSKLCSLPLIQVQIGIWLHSVEIKWLRLQGSHFTYIYEVCDNSPQQQKLARTERFNLVSLSLSFSFLFPPLMLNKFSRDTYYILRIVSLRNVLLAFSFYKLITVEPSTKSGGNISVCKKVFHTLWSNPVWFNCGYDPFLTLWKT